MLQIPRISMGKLIVIVSIALACVLGTCGLLFGTASSRNEQPRVRHSAQSIEVTIFPGYPVASARTKPTNPQNRTSLPTLTPPPLPSPSLPPAVTPTEVVNTASTELANEPTPFTAIADISTSGVTEQFSEFRGISCVPTQTPREQATLASVIDGDTIEVIINGETRRVRYIGVDTPERGQPGFAEATQANRELLAGQVLMLVKDVSETDRFGRLLRYVFAGNHFVNYEMVARGYARTATYPPDVACATTFVEVQDQARTLNLGIWKFAILNAPPSQPPTPAMSSPAVPTLPPAPPQPGSNCDPAYPTVCIPSPPPDLNCDKIPYRRFTVLPPDPHGFDRDKDGIGCERD